MKDREEIIPLLPRLRQPTFFTRDHGFYHPALRQAGYCLVYCEVGTDETAEYIRRFLRHRAFRSRAQRMGKVIRLRQTGISYWQVHEQKELDLSW
jgi:hypothetical protein